jgi:iron complex outermembrane receptor protein
MTVYFSLGASLAAIAVALPVQGASAQTEQQASAPTHVSSGTEDIIVTAQKRAENVQNVPLSIVAVSGDTLRSAGTQNVVDLGRIVPNLQITPGAQTAGISFRIRGFGAQGNNSLDQDVASYVDGVYIPRPGAALTSFLDVKTVEVLRGPQGTLFGRNAAVGAVSLTSNDPSFDKVGGMIAVEGGNYKTAKAEGVLNVPLSANAAFRVAGLASTSGGFFKNLYDGNRLGGVDNYVGRASFKWSPSSSFTLTLRGDYAKQSGNGFNGNIVTISELSPTQLKNFLAAIGNDTRGLSEKPSFTVNYNVGNPYLRDRQYGFSAHLDYTTSGDSTIRLISAYRNWHNRQNDGDILYTPLKLLYRTVGYDSKSDSHELQFISPADKLLGGRFSFIAGLYYFHEDYSLSERFDLGTDFCNFAVTNAAQRAACLAAPLSPGSIGGLSQNARSLAAYVQGDFKITPQLTLTGGFRYTKDRKRGHFEQTVNNPGAGVLRAPESTDLRTSDSQPSYRVNLSWKPSANLLAFASVSTGYKGAALSSGGSAAALGQARLLKAETVKNYEVGIKSNPFDRRLMLNITAFQTNISNFQDRSFDGTSFVIRNAGNVRARGVELETAFRITNHFRIEGGAAYLNSIYTKNPNAPGLPGCTGTPTCPRVQNLTGKPVSYAPKFQFNIAPTISDIPLVGDFSGRLRVSGNFITKHFELNDDNPQAVSPQRFLLGARFEVANTNGLSIAVFGENLTDHHYISYTAYQVLDARFGVRDPVTGSSLLRSYLGNPRTIGVRVAKTF